MVIHGDLTGQSFISFGQFQVLESVLIGVSLHLAARWCISPCLMIQMPLLQPCQRCFLEHLPAASVDAKPTGRPVLISISSSHSYQVCCFGRPHTHFDKKIKKRKDYTILHRAGLARGRSWNSFFPFPAVLYFENHFNFFCCHFFLQTDGLWNSWNFILYRSLLFIIFFSLFRVE